MTKIRTRDLIVIFVIAKTLSLLAAFYVFGLDGGVDRIDLLSHALSLTFFFGLLLISTKQSGSTLINDTSMKDAKWGGAITWAIVCIPLGFIVRFGVEGIYLVIANAYDHQLAIGEFNDIIARYVSGQYSFGWIFVIIALVGALDEEFVYRKIFLWHFSKTYGVTAGIFLTSLIFGIIHWNPVALMAAFCLACIYLASGRLWVVVVVHSSGNILHPLMGPFISKTDWSIYFSASIISSIIICVITVYFTMKIKRKMPLYEN